MTSISILGGGLAGGLIAYALSQKRPEVKFTLYERDDHFGGNHVWSFFEGDIAPGDRWIVEPFVTHRWKGYEVRFPELKRRLGATYSSIECEQFDAVLRASLPAERVRLGARVTETPVGAVIDTRGPGDLKTLDAGWQKFVGLEVHTAEPHGLTRPIVMDATVEQIDGYRFVYVLPFGPSTLFIEDTYYSDSNKLDVEAVKARVLDYAAAQGWRVTPANRQEAGVLPVVVKGSFDEYWDSTGTGVGKGGMRAGLFHATTGYSLPDAVRLASRIVKAKDLSAKGLEKLTRSHAKRAWNQRGFYRLLDILLFRGARPDERYRVMQRFYGLPEPLIARFYAAETSNMDKLRILTGKPPIPIPRAIGAILRNRK